MLHLYTCDSVMGIAIFIFIFKKDPLYNEDHGRLTKPKCHGLHQLVLGKTLPQAKTSRVERACLANRSATRLQFLLICVSFAVVFLPVWEWILNLLYKLLLHRKE